MHHRGHCESGLSYKGIFVLCQCDGSGSEHKLQGGWNICQANCQMGQAPVGKGV